MVFPGQRAVFPPSRALRLPRRRGAVWILLPGGGEDAGPPEVLAGCHPLQRLADGPHPHLPEGRRGAGRALPEHPDGAQHPQHRVPGPLRPGDAGGPLRPRRRLGGGRDHPDGWGREPSEGGHPLRGRRQRRVPDLRRGAEERRLRPRAGPHPAELRAQAAGDPQRHRHRPLRSGGGQGHRGELRPGPHGRQGGGQAAAAAALRSAGGGEHACHRHGDKARLPQGAGPSLRGAGGPDGLPRAAGCGGQRRPALRGLLPLGPGELSRPGGGPHRLQRGAGHGRLRRGGPLPDALPQRALRPLPDDRHALRGGAHRPGDRRPEGHGAAL